MRTIKERRIKFANDETNDTNVDEEAGKMLKNSDTISDAIKSLGHVEPFKLP